MQADEVLTLLGEERSLCDELSSLRGRQREMIDAGEAERLLEVLASKQRAIGRITELERRLRPLKTEWDRRRGDFPASQRIAIADAFREVRERLEELIRKETEDAEALSSRKEEASRELDTFDRKRRLETVYRRGEAPAGSRHLDHKEA